MKKILSVIIILSIFLTSCLKDDTINTEGGLPSTGTIIELPYTGLAYFSGKSIIVAGTDPIVEDIVINIADTRGVLLDKDLTVTLGIDDAARVAYNAANTLQYEAMPDSCYDFPVQTGVIPAGTNLDTLQVTFFPDKIDPTKNYMLPIQLKDASGQVISGNFSIAYYHTIGNPIAGAYNQQWIRWLNGTGAGAPNDDETFDGVFVPIDGSTISAESGLGFKYIVSFTKTGDVYSNWKIAFDKASLGDPPTTIGAGPTIVTADPATGTYEFQYTYINAGGLPRLNIDKFQK